MNRRQSLEQFIRRAKRSLNVEHSLPRLQYGLLLAFFLSSAILLVSRLFVFPFYRDAAIFVGSAALMATVLYIFWNRVRKKEALHRLDSFYPHNELVTALSLGDESNPLVGSILQKAMKETPVAFEQFKKRDKTLWKPKVLVGIVVVLIAMGALSIFPSATQQQALIIEEEKEVIKDLEKKVAELEKKSGIKETKKQLQELQNKLTELDTSEEALREVVKKQKELKLQEQKLKEKQELAKQESGEGLDGLTAEEQKQLEQLMELQKELANTANNTQTALSKLGKPISFDLQNAIASELGTESTENNNSNDEQSESSSEGDGQQSGEQGESQGSNEGSGQQSQGNNASSQNGQGQGQGNSSGNGSGTGTGKGSGGSGSGNGGNGSGSGSNGAGLGQGGRDLLSIPNRAGGSSETTVDGGSLSEGTAVGEQKGSVPVTKGTIQPYEEVIGDYKDSYLESSDRMQLPKDLQDIVQSYFSSIESE
ncbi:hypothetical protein [Ureibacillus sinduriensis]|uniref:Uncharacterized protein n=1 Tax=Ureibacillus sinduriensis BLB-1 = JCM 15800 TaxID=1384057 RepID=A0A0A3I038_9BACL|nr:hypothetical protein [Ureibacillus sinduriensis]KGR78094.1 hypothetical protein CD33_01615 [Ureibacillus sinduriensis BLB-1 = JCM 15800]